MAIAFTDLMAPPHLVPRDDDGAVAAFTRLVEARALLDVFSFIIGHELAHAWGYCPITAPSPVEISGMFDDVISMQTRGPLCPLPVKVAELNADRCALRTVAALEARVSADDRRMFKDSTKLRGVSRLLAAQAMNWIFNVGLAGSSAASVRFDRGTTVTVKPRGGYLYAPLRTALYATLLRALEDIPYVGACDNVGNAILKTLLVAARRCETDDKAFLRRWSQAGTALGHYFPANSAIHRTETAQEATNHPDPIGYIARCL